MNRQYKIGDTIGGELTVLEVFGGECQSGMGVVYLVEDRERTQPYVLKTFQKALDLESKKRFMSEAHAWIQAGIHPNIVQAYWAREIDQQLFIAAEYIEPDDQGRNTLSDFLQVGQLRVEIVLNWAAQFCYAMQYSLDNGILCHRDIKPDNLMIDRNRLLKITDFGLAKTIVADIAVEESTPKSWWLFRKKKNNKNKSVSETKTGSLLGTLPYMAPEQFFDSKGTDFHSDIYSFGIILFQMSSNGRYPYNYPDDSTTGEVIMQFARLHTKEKPTQIESPIMHVINKCLAKHKYDRYQSYNELLKDIQLVANELDISITAPPSNYDVEAEELYMKAQSYIALKQPDLAIKSIEEYVKCFPENHCGWTEKSRIHLERNEPSLAILAAQKSLSIFPYNSHAWNNLGIALKDGEKDLKKAVTAYENALKYDPNNTGAMMNMAIALSGLKQYDNIPQLLKRAISLTPKKKTMLFNMNNIAAVMMADGRLEEAKSILEALTDADPQNHNGWHNLALINWQQNQVEEAIHCFENVVRIDPSDEFAWLSLAKINFRGKNAKETIKYCNQLLKMGKEINAAVSMAAQVMNFTGNYSGAIQLLQDHLESQPENDVWWFILSEIHEFRENYKAALQTASQCKKILEKYSENADPDNLRQVECRIKRLESYLK